MIVFSLLLFSFLQSATSWQPLVTPQTRGRHHPTVSLRANLQLRQPAFVKELLYMTQDDGNEHESKSQSERFLDKDERQDEGAVTAEGRSGEVPIQQANDSNPDDEEEDLDDLTDEHADSLHTMMLADNPFDDEEGSTNDDGKNTQVAVSEEEKQSRVSNFEKNRPYLIAFSAGIAVAIVGRRLLALALRRGML
jgi:hypothetical protein